MSNHNCFINRPSKHEDEDELLRLSREFQCSKNTIPSAQPVKGQSQKVNSTSSTISDTRPTKPLSKFAQSRQKQLKRGYEGRKVSNEPNEPNITSNILLKDAVVEKTLLTSSNSENIQDSGMERRSGLPKTDPVKPFPEAIKWDKNILSPKEVEVKGQKKKVSIFAQQLYGFKSLNDLNPNITRDYGPMVEVGQQNRDWGAESRAFRNSKIVTSSEAKDIHSKNIALLNAMSEEQILEGQKEILEKLDSVSGKTGESVLQFLKRKWSKPSPTSNATEKECCTMNIDRNNYVSSITPNTTADFQNESDLKDDIIHNEIKNKYEALVPESIKDSKKLFKLDKFEHEKMEWMTDIDDSEEKNHPHKKSFNARFDFNGNLLPYVDNTIPVTAALHHHGEEPGRPGYTLEELLTLARSTFPQQRCIAFDTLSNIIKNAKHGRFDHCFGLVPEDKIKTDNDIKESYVNILVELLEADLVTLLRLALDEAAHTSNAVLDSAINCLVHIMDNEIEEIALDKEFFVSSQAPLQPCLSTKLCCDPEFIKDEKEMKDIQILKSDLVLGLLRMDILDRFTYLLSVTKPSNQTVINILKILSRMSRHSLQTASRIINHAKLLGVIFENFLPSRLSINDSESTIYSTPVHNALKLVRIAMSWGHGIASDMLNKFELGSKLLTYCSLIPGDSSNPVNYIQGKI